MKPVETIPEVRAWFEGRQALVLGLGKSGVAAATLLSRLGARTAVSDKKSARECAPWVKKLPSGVAVETASHRWVGRPWDVVVASPGVPPLITAPLRLRGVPLWGEMELGYRVLSLAGRWPSWSAAVTGTNGKTTTTSLLGAIFKAAGRPTVVAGNIGVPLCAVVNDVLPQGAIALEVSSYQLETAVAFHPAVGTILNVTPDHLARHGTMADYARVKFGLFRSFYPGETAVLNGADLWCRRGAKVVSGKAAWFGKVGSGAGWTWDGRWMRGPSSNERWAPPRYLPGYHNIENALAAVACARAVGVPVRAIARALSTFRGVEHRLEFVRLWRGVRFINDSKATNVDSTRVALSALRGPLTLILGGEHKGSPYTPLVPLIKDKVKEILLIGEAAPVIAKDLAAAAPMKMCGTLSQALDHVRTHAHPEDTVLLSPACASFDQFDNYEHRGQVFKSLVHRLETPLFQ